MLVFRYLKDNVKKPKYNASQNEKGGQYSEEKPKFLDDLTAVYISGACGGTDHYSCGSFCIDLIAFLIVLCCWTSSGCSLKNLSSK